VPPPSPRASGYHVAVPLFRKKPRTRADVVAAADKARGRGRAKKAAALYQEALRTDPDDPVVNARLGQVLARLGDDEGGALAFRRATAAHLKGGFIDRAAAVTASAAASFPLDPVFRLEGARLNLLRGRPADAVQGLVEGGRTLGRARRWGAAIPLLRRALELEKHHLEATLALAPALAKVGQKGEALALLGAQERYVSGRALTRVRWAVVRLRPTPRALWRWLTAR